MKVQFQAEKMEIDEAVPEAESLFRSLNQSTNVGPDGKGSHENTEGGKLDKGEEAIEGGLLDRLISNLGCRAPSSPKAGEGETNELKAEDSSDHINRDFSIEEDGGRGGLINKISIFFHPDEADEAKESEEQKNEETSKGVNEGDEAKKVKDNAGSEGIIDNIVSHLPASSLPDNASPTTDEAAILIHSIIHD